MIALALGMGWDPVDYHRAGHPVQRRMAAEVSRWSGLPEEEIPTAVDGCGVVCFATPLDVRPQVQLTGEFGSEQSAEPAEFEVHMALDYTYDANGA